MIIVQSITYICTVSPVLGASSDSDVRYQADNEGKYKIWL